MGRLLLIWRLVRGDMSRRRWQAALLATMIAATTGALTLSLALSGVMNSPFSRTRAATSGPDVAGLFEPGFHGTAGTPGEFDALRRAPGVVASSGPFPVARLDLSFGGHQVRVHAEGRASNRTSVDQPLITAGRWAVAGGVVIERGFATALHVRVGDIVRLNGRPLTVSGIAVTSAMETSDPLVWLRPGTLSALAGRSASLWYALNLRLADPARAAAFVAAHSPPNSAWYLETWQEIRADDGTTIADEQQLLRSGTALLAIVAVAGIAVMVGGRMAEQTRRVGLLKAIGATPRLVAVTLLTENLLLALAGTVAGLLIGRPIAPALTTPSASVLGAAGSPALTPATILVTSGAAMTVTLAATGWPAWRGARTSTLRALHGGARPPRRHALVIRLSSRLPVPLLLGLRLVVRRPRRAQLAVASVMIATAGVIATIMMRHTTVLGVKVAGNILAASQHDSLDHIGNILSFILAIVAAMNLLMASWATVLDAQRPSALARALGATPRQVAAALSGGQVGLGLVAVILGIPVGLVFYLAAGGNPHQAHAPVLLVIAVIPVTLIAIAALTAVPAALGARRPVAEVLQSE